MRLAKGTPIEVRTTRRPSCAMLLLYHTSRRTEGADVPLATSAEARSLKDRATNNKIKGEKGVGYVPSHHKRSKVRDMQLTLDINPNIDNHAQEREQEAQGYERESPSRIITRKCQDEQHHRSTDVGRHCVQIRLHSTIAQPRHDLWQKQLHALQRHPKTDFNRQYHPTRPLLEDLETLSKVKFLVHHGARIDLHTVVCQLFFFWREEFGCRGGLWKIEECEKREEDGAAPFDDEKIAPLCNGIALDLEDAER